MTQGRQYLLQAADEFEMNEWISLINYASSFKTVDIPMFAPLASPTSERAMSVFSDSQDASGVRSVVNTPSVTSKDLESPRQSLSPGPRRTSGSVKWPAGDMAGDSRIDYIKVSFPVTSQTSGCIETLAAAPRSRLSN